MDAFTTEQSLRQEAIRRRLEGAHRCDICAALGKSLSWFSRWWRRYCQDPQTDFHAQSRAPRTSPTRLPQGVEQAIVQIRKTFERAQCGLIGPAAIQHELIRQHIKPCPSQTTIQRVLRAHHLTHPQGAGASQAYYPELLATGPNDIHATDIITRHLWGGLAGHAVRIPEPGAHPCGGIHVYGLLDVRYGFRDLSRLDVDAHQQGPRPFRFLRLPQPQGLRVRE